MNVKNKILKLTLKSCGAAMFYIYMEYSLEVWWGRLIFEPIIGINKKQICFSKLFLIGKLFNFP